MKRKWLFVFIALAAVALMLTACDTLIDNGNIDVPEEILAQLPCTVNVEGLEGVTGKVELQLVSESAKETALRAIRSEFYVDEDAETYAVDISITNDGEEVTIAKPVTVSIELKTHLLPLDQYVVYHVHNGDVEEIVPMVSGDKLTFMVSSFSPFIIGPKHLHLPTSLIVDTPADCTHDGQGHIGCLKCHKTLSEEVIAALGHIDEDSDGKCDRCGVDMKPHDHADEDKDGKCDICGEKMGEGSETEPHVHSFGEWSIVIQPTCTEKGSKKRTCECGVEETAEVAATGHKDENKDGKCDVCGVDVSGGLYERDGDYIYFGSYPQTRVTDPTIESELISLAGAKPTAANPQKWTAYKYNVRKASTVADYMWYIDVKFDNVMYRGVCFQYYRPILPGQAGTAGDMTEQDKNGLQTWIEYWYRYEPIKWRILQESEGEALLLSELIIDSQETYSSDNYSSYIKHNGGTGSASNYQLSYIREWLNDFFYDNAFNEMEKELVLLTNVDNGARSTNPANNATEINNGNNKYAGHDTDDYVFLLSVQEATDAGYGFDAVMTASDGREKGHTDYAVSQGLIILPGDNDAEIDGDYRRGNNWRLRSVYHDMGTSVYVVDREGRIVTGSIDDTGAGIAPAIRISLLGPKPEEALPEGDAYVRVDANGVEKADGDYVLFGEYPQSRVVDGTIINALTTAAGELPTSENWHDWTSYDYYIDGYQKNYTFYIDIQLDGETYRGVYFTDYRPSWITNNNPQPSSYQRDPNGYYRKTVYWFRYDPIKWRILTEADGKALLLCELVIDGQDFYSYASSFKTYHNGVEAYTNDYELSDIRAWLNEVFYDTAFNALQQSVICETLVDNSDASTNPANNPTQWHDGSNPYVSSNTKDKVFLPSEQEITNPDYGFAADYSAKDVARQKKATEYAKALGVRARVGAAEYTDNVYMWWLRSPNSESGETARTVYYTGETSPNLPGDTLYGKVWYVSYGVVPALWISLDGAYVAEPETPHVHDIVLKEAKEAKCLAAGNKAYYTCTTCGKCFADAEGNNEISLSSVYIAALGHDLTEHKAKAATCTTEGNKLYYTCSKCGGYFTDNAGKIETTQNAVIINATGHKANHVDAKAADCLTAGNSEYYTCSVCGNVFSDSDCKNQISSASVVLAPLGHVDEDSDGKCDRCGISMTEAPLYTRDGDYIYFGSYPQTRITDDAIISPLSKLLGSIPSAEDDQGWTSYKYYIENSNATDYMWYKDVAAEDGKLYRAVYFTSFRPTGTNVPSEADRSMQDNNGYYTANVYWFRFEPVKWRVLKEIEGEYAMLLCDMIIDAQEYYSNFTAIETSHNGGTGYSNCYELSNIRKWLNGTFYNTAFSGLEQALIKTIMVDNSAESTTDATDTLAKATDYATDVTHDNVFLLSEREVTDTDYGFDAYDSVSESRQMKSSDYAKCQGTASFGGDYVGNGYWWLRSPDSTNGMNARVVTEDGKANRALPVTIVINGVVPALILKLSAE